MQWPQRLDLTEIAVAQEPGTADLVDNAVAVAAAAAAAAPEVAWLVAAASRSFCKLHWNSPLPHQQGPLAD